MPPARILVVEDHRATAQSLRKGLEEAGFEVGHASDGRRGLDLALEGPWDLLVLDLGLPKMDGWSLLEALRSGGQRLPVLILSAQDAVEDRVRGLDLGADDYLLKPFAFSELLSRIRALLRRQAPLSSAPVRHADLELFPAEFSAWRAGRRLDLSPREFALLALLLKQAGEPLSRRHLAEKVWNIRFDTETNAIDVAVSRLREKVDGPGEAPLIHTVRGVGYRLGPARSRA